MPCGFCAHGRWCADGSVWRFRAGTGGRGWCQRPSFSPLCGGSAGRNCELSFSTKGVTSAHPGANTVVSSVGKVRARLLDRFGELRLAQGGAQGCFHLGTLGAGQVSRCWPHPPQPASSPPPSARHGVHREHQLQWGGFLQRVLALVLPRLHVDGPGEPTSTESALPRNAMKRHVTPTSRRSCSSEGSHHAHMCPALTSSRSGGVPHVSDEPVTPPPGTPPSDVCGWLAA
jgi:hypothetical protein